MFIGISLDLNRRGGGGGFNPAAAYFAAGEQGVWYDPSDFSSMSQDSAGTTPVTATGQPVGLMFDKRLNLARSAEQVTGGDFSSATGWTLIGAGTAISGGVLSFTSSALNDYADRPPVTAFVAGDVLEVTYTINSISGSIRAQAGGAAGVNRTAPGTYTQNIVAAVAGNVAIVVAGAATTAVVDNFSVKKILGNHATQATAASRPLLQQDAGGKYYLAWDGVDDGMATAAINFSATNKMTVWAGYNPASTGTGVIAELSINAASQNGAFLQATGAINAGNDYFLLRGTLDFDEVYTAIKTVPRQVVSSVQFDTAAATKALRTIARFNQVQATLTESATATTAGNFGTHVLYLGARSGTGLFFNGRMYQLIVRGAQSTAQQITDGETYVNGKTGAF